MEDEKKVCAEYENFFHCREQLMWFVDPANPRLPSRLGEMYVSLWYSMASKVPPIEGRVLDFGTGGAIISLLASSQGASEIVTSAYLSEERQELIDWLSNDPQAMDWRPCLDMGARFEGNNVNSHDIARRVRQKVTDVLPCDIYKTNPFHPLNLDQFDVLTSMLILEAACPTEQTFKTALKRISRLVKPGGRVFIASALESDHYTLGRHRFETFPSNTSFLKRQFEALGFHDVTFEVQACNTSPTKPTESAVSCQAYIMHAVKNM